MKRFKYSYSFKNFDLTLDYGKHFPEFTVYPSGQFGPDANYSIIVSHDGNFSIYTNPGLRRIYLSTDAIDELQKIVLKVIEICEEVNKVGGKFDLEF